MRGAPAACQIGLDLQAAAAGGAGARRAMSVASPRGGHLAFVTAPSSSTKDAAYQAVLPQQREFAVMAAAAARGACPAAGVGSGGRGMVAPDAGCAPSAAAMRGLCRWSVAAESVGRRFFCGSGNLQTAAAGAGVHGDVPTSLAAASLRGVLTSSSSCAAYHGACSPRGRRFLPRALGDESAPSQNQVKPEPEKKPVRTLDEFIAVHPRSIAFLKLLGTALCICVCYLSAKGDPRVKVLVETAKDAVEVYTFLALVLLLLKKLLFPGSGSKRD